MANQQQLTFDPNKLVFPDMIADHPDSEDTSDLKIVFKNYLPLDKDFTKPEMGSLKEV